MKKYIACFLIFFGIINLSAQQATKQPQVNYNNSNADKLNRCQKMKKHGVIAMCVGGAGVIGGVILFVDALHHNISNSSNGTPSNSSTDLPKMYAGSILSGIGVLMISGGATLYIIGQKRENRLKGDVSITIAPTAFRMAYTF